MVPVLVNLNHSQDIHTLNEVEVPKVPITMWKECKPVMTTDAEFLLHLLPGPFGLAVYAHPPESVKQCEMYTRAKHWRMRDTSWALMVLPFIFSSGTSVAQGAINIEFSFSYPLYQKDPKSVHICPWEASKLLDQWVEMKGAGELHHHFSVSIRPLQNTWASTLGARRSRGRHLGSFSDERNLEIRTHLHRIFYLLK